ncbi:MAG: OPT/YSL family transporter [Faecalibacterium sp.]
MRACFLLGATPRVQQIGELIGVVASAAAIGAVLNLLNTAWGFGTGELGAPQAMMMKMIVEGVMGGNMPWTLVFIGVFLAVVLELLGLPVLPVAIGIYLPVHMTAGIMLGGVVREVVERMPLGKADDREECIQSGILYSSGLIAGEGLVGIVLAVLAVLGINIDLSAVFSLGDIGTIVLFALLALSLILIARRGAAGKNKEHS